VSDERPGGPAGSPRRWQGARVVRKRAFSFAFFFLTSRRISTRSPMPMVFHIFFHAIAPRRRPKEAVRSCGRRIRALEPPGVEVGRPRPTCALRGRPSGRGAGAVHPGERLVADGRGRRRCPASATPTLEGGEERRGVPVMWTWVSTRWEVRGPQRHGRRPAGPRRDSHCKDVSRVHLLISLGSGVPS